MSLRIVEKILNISSHEVPKTLFAWTVRLLHQAGIVIGMTTVTAIFVTRFSIASLPFLFLIQASLTILGMVLFSFLNDFFSTKFLIATCSLAAAFCLFASTLFLKNDWWFFSFLFLTLGVFIPQLTILISSLVEDYFSPLEGERIFPIIESSHTLGGIFAGILITSLSLFVPSYKFLYVWILFLFLMASVIFFLEPVTSSSQILTEKSKKISLVFSFQNLKKNFIAMKSLPFLQALFVIFLLQWILGHFLEFQYTKVIEETIEHVGSAEAREGILAHGLGTFQILFHGSALLVQLLIASRLLKILGVTGGFLLHGLVTLFSAISLMFGFGYFTLILAKNNFEISGIIHNNAYEASYYALKHGTQKSVREFFEAFLYPLGTIIGTLLLLGIQEFFTEEHSLKVIQLLFLLLALGMTAVSLHLQNTYTSLAKENLLKSKDQISKLHAIEILSQKGHQKGTEILLQSLYSSDESAQTKVKILEILGRAGNTHTISDILYFFHSKEPSLILASVKALENFPKLGKHIFSQAFARYRVVHELKQLFVECSHEEIQIAAIKTLAKLQDQEIVSFLLNILKNAAPSLQAHCIKVFALFHDPNVAYFLEPYLKSKDVVIKTQTIAALWQFEKYRPKLQTVMNKLLSSSLVHEASAALSVFAEISQSRDKQMIIPFLTVTDPELRLLSSTALLKLGYKEAASYFVPLLLSKHQNIAEKAYKLLADFKPDLQKHITHLLKKEISRRFYHGVRAQKHQTFFQELLETLKKIYICIESYHEADYIETMLRKSPFVPTPLAKEYLQS